ncbi:LpxD N-terminal domain-containing protein [Halosegnis marinus]|uniref:LpxD N-terminal domain-containing protein n=1 Tax=Halosegnis marinus TaxID=3034023 RepID=A0ABD5ZS41_9EURY|nr:LpxD N-terminal domain-containing protein [Halosegnis sp. DT85]
MDTARAPTDGQLSSLAVASLVGADHRGPERAVRGFDALDAAGPDDLAFCVHEDPAAVRASDAGVVVCPPALGHLDARTLVVHPNPKLAFVRVLDAAFDAGERATGVHPTATVEPDATLGEGCSVGPNAYVAGCVTLGDGVRVRAGAALGCPGFGFVRDEEGRLVRRQHVGTVRVAAEVEIGANAAVDRAVFGETRVGERAKLSGGVHVAHGARVGPDTTVAFASGLAGGADVGARVTVHPNVAVATGVTVGDGAELGMGAAVLDDVAPGVTVVGAPARPV